jgi:hypothetical protein
MPKVWLFVINKHEITETNLLCRNYVRLCSLHEVDVMYQRFGGWLEFIDQVTGSHCTNGLVTVTKIIKDTRYLAKITLNNHLTKQLTN